MISGTFREKVLESAVDCDPTNLHQHEIGFKSTGCLKDLVGLVISSRAHAVTWPGQHLVGVQQDFVNFSRILSSWSTIL